MIYRRTIQHLVKVEQCLLMDNPESIREHVFFPPDDDPDRQLAFALAKFGTPQYSEAVNNFINNLFRKTNYYKQLETMENNNGN